jgi:hypothetical protein
MHEISTGSGVASWSKVLSGMSVPGERGVGDAAATTAKADIVKGEQKSSSLAWSRLYCTCNAQG